MINAPQQQPIQNNFNNQQQYSQPATPIPQQQQNQIPINQHNLMDEQKLMQFVNKSIILNGTYNLWVTDPKLQYYLFNQLQIRFLYKNPNISDPLKFKEQFYQHLMNYKQQNQLDKYLFEYLNMLLKKLYSDLNNYLKQYYQIKHDSQDNPITQIIYKELYDNFTLPFNNKVPTQSQQQKVHFILTQKNEYLLSIKPAVKANISKYLQFLKNKQDFPQQCYDNNQISDNSTQISVQSQHNPINNNINSSINKDFAKPQNNPLECQSQNPLSDFDAISQCQQSPFPSKQQSQIPNQQQQFQFNNNSNTNPQQQQQQQQQDYQQQQQNNNNYNKQFQQNSSSNNLNNNFSNNNSQQNNSIQQQQINVNQNVKNQEIKVNQLNIYNYQNENNQKLQYQINSNNNNNNNNNPNNSINIPSSTNINQQQQQPSQQQFDPVTNNNKDLDTNNFIQSDNNKDQQMIYSSSRFLNDSVMDYSNKNNISNTQFNISSSNPKQIDPPIMEDSYQQKMNKFNDQMNQITDKDYSINYQDSSFINQDPIDPISNTNINNNNTNATATPIYQKENNSTNTLPTQPVNSNNQLPSSNNINTNNNGHKSQFYQNPSIDPKASISYQNLQQQQPSNSVLNQQSNNNNSITPQANVYNSSNNSIKPTQQQDNINNYANQTVKSTAQIPEQANNTLLQKQPQQQLKPQQQDINNIQEQQYVGSNSPCPSMRSTKSSNIIINQQQIEQKQKKIREQTDIFFNQILPALDSSKLFVKMQKDQIKKDITTYLSEKNFEISLETTKDEIVFNINLVFLQRKDQYGGVKIQVGPFDDLYEIIDCNKFSLLKINKQQPRRSNKLNEVINIWWKFQHSAVKQQQQIQVQNNNETMQQQQQSQQLQ